MINVFVANENPIENLPTWDKIIHLYGPFLGSFMFFIIMVVILQFYWYRENLKSKNQEIDRSVKRTTDLELQLKDLFDQILKMKS